MESGSSVEAPTREEVINYAAGLGIAGTPAATFWAHGDQTKWTMRDGQKVHDWRACFRLWIEKMQGRPGFEIVLHHRSKSAGDTIAELERQRRQKEHKTFDIVRLGRESKAPDGKIIAALRSRGLVWPDYADVRYARPESEADAAKSTVSEV